jgi:RNA polymerase sigma factor (TIGR02999 family)
LQATALVHEAYLRLLNRAGAAEGGSWNSRAHFFAAAAEAMRRILVENARRKRRYKRGSDHVRVAIDIAGVPSPTPAFDMLEIADVLADLELEHPEHATVVKLRYFVGMTIAECADALGVATPTVERRWRYARAWLAQRLHEGP